MELLAKLLGYMPKAQALAQGFTHHGEMYGIPCWVGDVDGDGPMVATKWAPMEWAVSVGHWFMGLHADMTGEEPFFRIYIGAPIEP